MLSRIKQLPSPALVIAAIALIVAVGGGTFAIASSDRTSDKRIAKRVSNARITARAPALSVNHANTADNATNATTANNANNLGGAPPSAYAGSAQQAFIAPTLNAGYSNFGGAYSTAGYMKDSLGFVHLKGTLNCPAGGGNAFTLPVGFRPGQSQYMVQINGAAGKILYIQSTGEVQTAASPNQCGLDGIVFPAAGTAGTTPVQASGTGGATPGGH